jgi:hypothetical protein
MIETLAVRGGLQSKPVSISRDIETRKNSHLDSRRSTVAFSRPKEMPSSEAVGSEYREAIGTLVYLVRCQNDMVFQALQIFEGVSAKTGERQVTFLLLISIVAFV